MIFDHDLDRSGGIKKTKEPVKILEDICLEQDLLDIWCVRNPTEKRFTWRQKTGPNYYSETFGLLVGK